MSALFKDRSDAGERLAKRLLPLARREDVVALGLPRGGIPVAYEVAQLLDAPLEVFVVRKLGLPGKEEMAIGAIASGGIRVLDQRLIEHLGIPRDAVERVTETELEELRRRERAYRGNGSPPDIDGRVAILIDDGLATGASMSAAIAALRELHPGAIVVAVPVAPPETCEALRHLADVVVCLHTPSPFHSVGQWYENFDQTTDDEVRTLVERAADRRRGKLAKSAKPLSAGQP